MPSLGRTPPNDNVNRTVETESDTTQPVQLTYPTQRLGAVTRLKNNLQELLPNLSANKIEIQSLYKTLEIKIEVFKDLCEEELLKNVLNEDRQQFIKWFEENYREMVQYQQKIANMLRSSDNPTVSVHMLMQLL